VRKREHQELEPKVVPSWLRPDAPATTPIVSVATVASSSRMGSRLAAAQISVNPTPLSSRPKAAQTRVPAIRKGCPVLGSKESMNVSASTLRMAPGSISLRSGAGRAPRRVCQ
jgi:hypothetical protein